MISNTFLKRPSIGIILANKHRTNLEIEPGKIYNIPEISGKNIYRWANPDSVLSISWFKYPSVSRPIQKIRLAFQTDPKQVEDVKQGHSKSCSIAPGRCSIAMVTNQLLGRCAADGNNGAVQIVPATYRWLVFRRASCWGETACQTPATGLHQLARCKTLIILTRSLGTSGNSIQKLA